MSRSKDLPSSLEERVAAGIQEVATLIGEICYPDHEAYAKALAKRLGNVLRQEHSPETGITFEFGDWPDSCTGGAWPEHVEELDPQRHPVAFVIEVGRFPRPTLNPIVQVTIAPEGGVAIKSRLPNQLKSSSAINLSGGSALPDDLEQRCRPPMRSGRVGSEPAARVDVRGERSNVSPFTGVWHPDVRTNKVPARLPENG
jgi:hypothetical protein